METWALTRTDDGSPTLAHPGHGQTCHSRAGAWTEARERYALACELRERALALARSGAEPVFELLDVGTGLGLNLAAALEALDGTGVVLHALSLELERDVIERTLALAQSGELHAGAPAELVRAHAPVLDALAHALREPERAAAEGVALGAGRLTLLLGDGRATLARTEPVARFDAVFLDPFSPQVDAALWEPAFVREIARRMTPRARLSTYSSSLAVRAALSAAGLTVAPGGRVGTKASGTLASWTALESAFDPRTARRVARRAAELVDGTANAREAVEPGS
jgi:tRNA U34 5-methylaminomethyl-2-thiouridine-forming methyltransferase MnmC